jgi:hypothetical protein
MTAAHEEPEMTEDEKFEEEILKLVRYYYIGSRGQIEPIEDDDLGMRRCGWLEQRFSAFRVVDSLNRMTPEDLKKIMEEALTEDVSS